MPVVKRTRKPDLFYELDGLEAQGAAAELMGPAPFGKFIEGETAKWEKVVREGNIKGEE